MLPPLIQASQSTEFSFGVPSYRLKPRTPMLPAFQFNKFGPQFLNVVSVSLTPLASSRHHIPSNILGFPGSPRMIVPWFVYKNNCSDGDLLLTFKCIPSIKLAVKFRRPPSGNTKTLELINLMFPSVTRLVLNAWLIRILQLSKVISLPGAIAISPGLLVPPPSLVVIIISSINSTF